MLDPIFFAGCIIVFIAFGAVMFHFRTGLFGLTALCVFHVTAATMSAFFFGFLLNEIPDSFTPEHEQVWTYSLLGLFAMVAGVYVGWRPLAEIARQFPRGTPIAGAPAHINEDLGWLSFLVGMAAYILLSTVRDVPTISTAVNCISTLARIGLLIMLASALGSGRWRKFLIAAGVYSFLSIVGSFSSGHTFIRIDTVVPMVIVYIASSRFDLRFVVPTLLTSSALVPLVGAWMNSRDLIRSGSLENFSLFDKAVIFFVEFIGNLELPSAESFMDLLLLRVDMSGFLAAQVIHQPEVEPYAYGETVYSALYTLIPRAIWNDKPVVAGGSEFFQRFTGIVRPLDDVTSIGIAYPFELYANGGPVLVVVGLGVIGFACARLELNLLRTPKSLGSFWALALATAVLADGGQRTDVVLPALVSAWLAAYAVGWLFTKYYSGLGILRTPVPPTANVSQNIDRVH